MSDTPPYHWRAGRGYISPATADEPAPQQDGGYFTPLPFPGGPPLFYGPPPGFFGFPLGPPPSFPALPPYAQYPVGPPPSFFSGTPASLLSWHGPTLIPPTEEEEEGSATSSSSGDSDDEDKQLFSKPQGTKLAGGLRKGFGFLFTGKPCHLGVIDSTHIGLDNLLSTCASSKKFRFSMFSAMDNSTVNELMEALGGGDTSSITQVWEWGSGFWKKGTVMKYGDDKSKQELADLGWSEAGSNKKPHVWLYFKEAEKTEKKKRN